MMLPVFEWFIVTDRAFVDSPSGQGQVNRWGTLPRAMATEIYGEDYWPAFKKSVPVQIYSSFVLERFVQFGDLTVNDLRPYKAKHTLGTMEEYFASIMARRLAGERV